MREVGLRGWLVFGSLVLSACMVDLTPDVGSLIARGNEPVTHTDAGPGWNYPAPDAGADGGEGELFPDELEPAMDAGSMHGDAAIAQGDAEVPNPPVHDAGPSCGIKDSNPLKDVSFKDDVWPILEVCRCHSSEDDEQFGILEANLTIDNYATLREGGDNTGSSIIVPGNACDSIMLQKLSENPPFGNRMPNMGPYLSAAERTILADWIIEGAKNN